MARWKVFLCSMLVTLFCLVPLYLLLIGGQLFGSAPAGAAAGSVPVEKAGPDDSLTLLLMTDAPCTALVRLDAYGRRAELRVLPENTVLLSQGSPVTLEECRSEAGPLQVRRCLQETLGLGCERYLSLSAEQLADVFDEFAPVLSWNDLGPIRDLVVLRRFAFNGGQGAVASDTAALLLRQSGLTGKAQADLRAELYGAFLAEGLPQLSGPVCALLRSDEERLTDITAVDIYGIERLLNLLAADPPGVQCSVPDGRETAAGYELSQQGLEDLRRVFSAES